MDLAIVFLVVVVGVALIAYAGMATPRSRRPASGDSGTPVATDRETDAPDSGDGGAD